MLADRDVVSIIHVRDAERAREFYERVLGLRFIADDGYAMVFEVSGRFLRLARTPELTPQPFSVIAWQVPDIAATVRGLAGRGVAFERYPHFEQDELGVWQAPDDAAKVAWFKDPDGNLLSLVESANDRP